MLEKEIIILSKHAFSLRGTFLCLISNKREELLFWKNIMKKTNNVHEMSRICTWYTEYTENLQFFTFKMDLEKVNLKNVIMCRK